MLVSEEKQAEPKVQPAQPKSGLNLKLILIPVLLVAVAVGAYFWLSSRGTVSSDDAQVDGHIITVAPKVTGTVAEVLVNDNQHVKAGQVILRIDPRDYQAKVDQAKASLALARSQATAAQVNVPLTSETTASGVSSAQAQLEGAQADFLRAQASFQQASSADLSYARANVENKQANFERAQADLKRMSALVAKAEISQQQYDSYVAASKMAESDLRAAQDRLASAGNSAEIAKAGIQSSQSRIEQARAALQQSKASTRQVAVRGAEVSSSMAGIQQAQANLEAAELQLSYCTITAPVDGVITRKSVEIGNQIQPGQSLLTVIPEKDVWITANFKETQLAEMKPGQKVEIKVDMYGTTIEGKVDSIANATGARLSLLPPENATGNFVKVVQRIPVKILVDPAQLDKTPLRVGMNVDVTVRTDK